MLSQHIQKFKYGEHTITLETGIVARQSTASVIASMDDTTVLVTVVGEKQAKLNQKFFPLNVSYQERTYAAGRFPGGFFRREGRPNEIEMLISRLIDRPIRPLFPNGFFNEVQIIVTVVSINPEINPDIIAMIGSSAALSLSGIPFRGPIGAARVGYINNKYILNPISSKMINSSLNLIISGTSTSILMVESESKFLSEDHILSAITYGHEQQKIVIENINIFSTKAGKEKWNWIPQKTNNSLLDKIKKLSESQLIKAYLIIEKKERQIIINNIKNEIFSLISDEDHTIDQYLIFSILESIEKKIVREKILENEIRIDGRKNNIVRDLDIRVGILPRTHGSALFTRGETQALVTATLGTERDAQNVDELMGGRIERFLLHYNFPPYCVGETGIVGSPKRREIGHGRLAKRAILATMPTLKEFPYTIRVVSEITESNGSSSMASVCGASLALMDAGVPIKEAIAGVAMGLIKEKEKFVILSDIVGDEDHIGDMDLKIAGSKNGITALQMDIKIEGITENIMKLALYQAKNARISILKKMEKAISTPRKNISEFAPRIHFIKINPDKIKDVIGKGGSVIKSLTEEFNSIIEIEDNGIIKIASMDRKKIKQAVHRIKEITDDLEIGKIYDGKITRIVDFGIFIMIGKKKEGLVHTSQISNTHKGKITNYFKLGQEVKVKVLEIGRQGRIRLSMKETKN